MPKTLSEIKKEGWDVLVEKLGIADATMFVMEHERGHGDYTEERKNIFAGKNIDTIAQEIRELNFKDRH